MSRDEQGRGGGGSKIGNFKQTYFLNATKVELNPVDSDRNTNHLIWYLWTSSDFHSFIPKKGWSYEPLRINFSKSVRQKQDVSLTFLIFFLKNVTLPSQFTVLLLGAK